MNALKKRFNGLRKMVRRERALVCALFPIPYIAATLLLFGITSLMQYRLYSVGLLWQCLSAFGYTLYVLAPLCFVFSGGLCVYHAVRGLRRREAIRKNAILIAVAVATIVLSAVWFWQFWYV